MNTYDQNISLGDFLAEARQPLTEIVGNRLQPTFTTLNTEYSELLGKLLRKPFLKQEEAIQALTNHLLKVNTSAIDVGEMGTGKTLMFLGIAWIIAHYFGKGFPKSRIGIMCPSSLASKWEGEIKATIPGKKSIKIISNLEDAIEMVKNAQNKVCEIEFYIFPKDSIKLGSPRQEGHAFRNGKACCPDCGSDEIRLTSVKTSMPRCKQCNAALYQPDLKREEKCSHCKRNLTKAADRILRGGREVCKHCHTPIKYSSPKISVADYLKKNLPRKFFHLFVVDELHEMKNGASAQSLAMGQLASLSKMKIGLTGTLMGGYAKDLFYNFYKLFPATMKKVAEYSKPDNFSQRFGSFKEIEKESIEAGQNSNNRKPAKVVKEAPGVSPQIIPLLLQHCFFLRLQDVRDMVPYTEHIVALDMDPTQDEQYSIFEREVQNAVRQALVEKDKGLIHAIVSSIVPFPDRPNTRQVVRHPHKLDSEDHSWTCSNCKSVSEEKNACGCGEEFAVAGEPRNLIVVDNPGFSGPSPKERWLVRRCKKSLADGRKVLVFINDIGKHDISPRLISLLGAEGIKAQTLYSDNPTAQKRVDWLEVNKPDVIITNPETVKTGLDMLEYLDIVVYQYTYRVFTLLQATHRSWRVNQELPVRVFYLNYKNTLQVVQKKLVGSKVGVTMSVQGHAIDPGALAMEDDDNDLLALAKMLAEGIKYGDDNTTEIFGGAGTNLQKWGHLVTDDTPADVVAVDPIAAPVTPAANTNTQPEPASAVTPAAPTTYDIEQFIADVEEVEAEAPVAPPPMVIKTPTAIETVFPWHGIAEEPKYQPQPVSAPLSLPVLPPRERIAIQVIGKDGKTTTLHGNPRGMVFHVEGTGIAVVGNAQFVFKGGKIHYGDREIGAYQGKKGMLNGKPILLHAAANNNQVFGLYELKAA